MQRFLIGGGFRQPNTRPLTFEEIVERKRSRARDRSQFVDKYDWLVEHNVTFTVHAREQERRYILMDLQYTEYEIEIPCLGEALQWRCAWEAK